VTVVVWTPQAREDLQALYDYIANDSERYAAIVASQIIAAVGQLEHFPESGRVVPELHGSDLREILWRSYRIVYRHNSDRAQAHILTVSRSERLFPQLR
jgi:addiction module RelE/StbE family toxin